MERSGGGGRRPAEAAAAGTQPGQSKASGELTAHYLATHHVTLAASTEHAAGVSSAPRSAPQPPLAPVVAPASAPLADTLSPLLTASAPIAATSRLNEAAARRIMQQAASAAAAEYSQQQQEQQQHAQQQFLQQQVDAIQQLSALAAFQQYQSALQSASASPAPLAAAPSTFSPAPANIQMTLQQMQIIQQLQQQQLQHQQQLQQQQQQHHHPSLRASPPASYFSPLPSSSLLASPLLRLPSPLPPPTHQHIHVEPHQLTSTRAYVGNLSFLTGWQDLTDWFQHHIGVRAKCEIIAYPSGRSKGCAIVEFESVEDAASAINLLSGKEIAGRKVFIREDRENKGFASGSERRAAQTKAAAAAAATAAASPLPGLLQSPPQFAAPLNLRGGASNDINQSLQQAIFFLAQQQQQQQQQSSQSSFAQLQAPPPRSPPSAYPSMHMPSPPASHMNVPASSAFYQQQLMQAASLTNLQQQQHQQQQNAASASPMLFPSSMLPPTLYAPRARSTPPRRPSFSAVASGSGAGAGVQIHADIVTDRVTGQSKGFGSVRFEDAQQASNAISHLNGRVHHGRKWVARFDEFA